MRPDLRPYFFTIIVNTIKKVEVGMMSMKTRILLLIVILTLLAGCARGPVIPAEPAEIRETITLYYGDDGNEKLVEEEREIVYLQEDDRYQAAIEGLIRGPQTTGYRANISQQTRVYGTILQDDAILINLSREFAQFGGSVAEIVGVLSVVNTLTQFEGIERVKILVEGEEMIGPSGEPYGFMAKFNQELAEAVEEKTVILYFANADATLLVAEERNVAFQLNTPLDERLKRILEELIRGPQNAALGVTIPPEVRVLSLEMRDRLALINFSEEMHTRHAGGATGEAMTILSIVNTLTEFETVEFVQMNVDGAPMNIEHVILDAPVQRNEEMISREGQ
jgi:germination protein M